MCTHDTAYALQDLDNREGFFFFFHLPNGMVREQLLQETGLSWA